jgi:ribonuclease J
MVLHAQISEGLDQGTDTFIMTDGDVLEVDAAGNANYGERVQCDYVYVDGLGVGDIDHVVLRDRKHLAADGMVVVILPIDKQTSRLAGQPEVVSRGFVDMDEKEDLIERTRDHVAKGFDVEDHAIEWGAVQTEVKESVAKFLYDETRRRPMVLPVRVEV